MKLGCRLTASRAALLACCVMVALCGGGCRSSRHAAKGRPGASELTVRGDRPWGPGGASAAVVDLSQERLRLVREAQSWLGTPYRYGGHDRQGADCSGMVMEVFRSAVGIDLPRNSLRQQQYCRRVDDSEALAGDLVFFTGAKEDGGIGHVGLYVGDGRMIHSTSSRGVVESRMDEPYWARHYANTGRVPALDEGRMVAAKAPKKQPQATVATASENKPKSAIAALSSSPRSETAAVSARNYAQEAPMGSRDVHGMVAAAFGAKASGTASVDSVPCHSAWMD